LRITTKRIARSEIVSLGCEENASTRSVLSGTDLCYIASTLFAFFSQGSKRTKENKIVQQTNAGKLFLNDKHGLNEHISHPHQPKNIFRKGGNQTCSKNSSLKAKGCSLLFTEQTLLLGTAAGGKGHHQFCLFFKSTQHSKYLQTLFSSYRDRWIAIYRERTR
jgi:hypothetical protein